MVRSSARWPGLPLLLLFAVPAAVLPDGLGWWPFALGAAGWLGLLLAGCGAGSALFENVGSNLDGVGGEPAEQPEQRRDDSDGCDLPAQAQPAGHLTM